MKLTKYSENRLLGSLDHWHVPRDYAEPMYNYLVYGFEPGGFFTAVLANDFFSAMCRSHPANSVPALKDLAKWILNSAPHQAVGSKEKVLAWMRMPEAERRKILEQCELIFTEAEEIEKVLKDEPTKAPYFWH